MEDLPYIFDLGSLNILSNNGGNVTGILDWSGSQYLPRLRICMVLRSFGGYVKTDGWVNRKEKDELEKLFWNALHRRYRVRGEKLEFAITIAKGIRLLRGDVGPYGVNVMLKKYPRGLMYLKALLQSRIV